MGFHEVVESDEETRFERYAAELVELARKRAAGQKGTRRALHVKQHLGALGEFAVNADGRVREGVFSEQNQRYPLYARFSNGGSAQQSDSAPDARGFAIKLVGVEGPKIIRGLEQEVTQDFLFIDTPSIPLRDPEEFMALVRAAKDGPALLVPRLVSGLGFGRTLSVMGRLLKTPKVKSFATHTFHTAVPISFGSSAAKLSLVPASSPKLDKPMTGDDYLRKDLAARLRQGRIEWVLRAQLFRDDTSTPIEDSSVTWTGPWFDLAKVTLFQQDVDSASGQRTSELVEQFSFDPWHSIAEHRPLGAIMRARAVAYRESVIARKAAPEPRSIAPG